MKQELSKPIEIEYDGWDADANRVDALQFGQSVQGAARLYKSAFHLYFTGNMPRHGTEVRVLVGPPLPGTLTYLLWMMIAHGQLVLFPQVLCELVDLCAPEIVKTSLSKLSGQTKEAEKSMTALEDIARAHPELANRFAEYAMKVEDGHQRDKQALREHIDVLTSALARRNTTAAIDIVKPVGRSVRQIAHAKETVGSLIIDEPSTDVIRSKGELEVRDTEFKKVRLGAVDEISRTCKILTEESSIPIKGKITDPAIENTNNIYSHALYQGAEIVITGKPVFKDGDLITFYISDARGLKDGE